jgi:phosphoglycerate dehydrogenase-like enzyme
MAMDPFPTCVANSMTIDHQTRVDPASPSITRPVGNVRVAVLNDYQRAARSSANWDPVLARAEVTFIREPVLDADDIRRKLSGFDVLCIMRERLAFTRETFELLPNLKCLVTTGTANRAIDLQAAQDHGVVVSGTTNGFGRLATAELAWGLILGLARRIPQEDRAARSGQWQTSVGSTVYGKTLGIIGLGGVGRHVARYAKAFGMEVLAWSRNLTQETALESCATRVELHELLARSDFVTLHAVLSKESTGLIGRAELQRMAPSAYLVNTSRGPLVDEAALIDALRNGAIAGAALDVFDIEPLPAGHAFFSMDNVVLTPHIGYVTTDVYAEFFRETVRSVLAYLDGKPIRLLLPAASPN